MQLLGPNGSPVPIIDISTERAVIQSYMKDVIANMPEGTSKRGFEWPTDGDPVKFPVNANNLQFVFRTVPLTYCPAGFHFRAKIQLYLNPIHRGPWAGFARLPANDLTPHACLLFMGLVINISQQRQLVLEGHQDGHLDFRTTLQNVSKLYCCAPDEVAAQYPRLLDWYTIPGVYQPPASLETLIANKQEQINKADGVSGVVKK